VKTTWPLPVALYGVVLLMSALAWYVMQRTLLCVPGNREVLLQALGRDRKGRLSPLFYLLGIGLSFYSSWLGAAVYGLLALWWLVPDRRMEQAVSQQH
jgi:uncharacterized membrane protein